MANPNLTKALSERSKSYETPYEFVFKINNNIIAQRFFSVNNYNPNSYWSHDLKESVDECVNIIQRELKMRTLVFMDEYKYFFDDDPNFDTNNSPDIYYFQVKINGRIVLEKGWDATLYPAKIRYDVNIKKYISRIIYLISGVLSVEDDSLSYQYSNKITKSLKMSDYDPIYDIEEID